jgi:hypothetical protein
LIRMNLS